MHAVHELAADVKTETGAADTLTHVRIEAIELLEDALLSVPRSHLALLWISAHMPRTADAVLAAAKLHFADAVAA